MKLIIFLLYVCFSFILFLLLNMIPKNSKNSNLFKIIFPIIYIIILAGIFSEINFSSFNDNLFLIVIIEFIIRIYYTNYILKQDVFLEEKYYSKLYSCSIILSYVTNIYFINKVESVFPNLEDMKVIIWLLIFYFFSSFIKIDFSFSRCEDSERYNEKRKEYFIVSYTKLKIKYHDILVSKYSDLIPLVYAIMVFENNKKPAFVRRMDGIKSKFTGILPKQGIMQVSSRKILTDDESIVVVIKQLEKIYSKLNTSKKISKSNLIENILSQYYKKDSCYQEVLSIYHEIKDFDGIK